MSDIENRIFFELRARANEANGELQVWAENHLFGKTITWEYSDHKQEGIVLKVVRGAVIVKNSKSRSEVSVKFGKVQSIND